MTLKEIADHLNGERIPTATGKYRWTISNVQTTLKTAKNEAAA
jgi:hypothetical protein